MKNEFNSSHSDEENHLFTNDLFSDSVESTESSEHLSVSPEVCKQPGGPKGFSAIASCKAQGLIPRADGRIYKSKEKLGLHPGGLRRWFYEQTPPKSIRERIEKKSGEPFPGGWVRVSDKTGEILGPCGRRDSKDNSTYPKCMSYQQWKNLSRKERIRAAKEKRSKGIPAAGKGNKPKFIPTKLSSCTTSVSSQHTYSLSSSVPSDWDGIPLVIQHKPNDVVEENGRKVHYHDFSGYFKGSRSLNSDPLRFLYSANSNPSNKIFVIEEKNSRGLVENICILLGYQNQVEALNAYLLHFPLESFGSIYEISSSVLHTLSRLSNELNLSNNALVNLSLDKLINQELGVDSYPIKFVLSDNTSMSTSVRPMLKIPVAKLGSWVHPVYTRVEFTEKDFDDIVRNFENRVLGFPPYCRYGHSKHPGSVDAEPSLGEVKKIVREGNVLYSIVEPNNDEVVEEIKLKKYRFSSPELTRNFIDKETGKNVGTVLTAISLTNAPFLPNLPDNQVLSSNCPDSKEFFVLNLSECVYSCKDDKTKYFSDYFQSVALPSNSSLSNSKTMEQDTTMVQSVVTDASSKTLNPKLSRTAQSEEQAMDILKDGMRVTKTQDAQEELEKKMQQLKMDEQDEQEKQEMSKKAAMASKDMKDMKEKMSNSAQDLDVNSTEQLLLKIQNLSNQITELSNWYQTQLKESNERLAQALSLNAQLETRLRETETKTEYLTSKAYLAELNSRKMEYLRKGVPPFLVNKVFDLIQTNPTQQIRLSNGEVTTLQSQLEELLAGFPPELAVKFEQFSSTATQHEKVENPFRSFKIIN